MKRKINRYDVFIDTLSKNFSQINNFQLTQEEGIGKTLFDFIIKRLAEINSFKILFSNYYIPSASKSITDDLNEISKSKYRYLITISKDDLKENYYETIRLGYIGMFHKYENYIDELLIHAENLNLDINDKGQPLIKYIEENFNFKFKDWKHSPTISRLNWICICNKHYDGYPTKEPKNIQYISLPNHEKMKFTKDDFVRDIDMLIKIYELMLQAVLNFVMYKVTFEFSESENFEDEELRQKHLNTKTTVNLMLNKFIEIFKSL